jgi:hypothetical protein
MDQNLLRITMPVSDMTGDECFYVNFEVTHFEVAILQFIHDDLAYSSSEERLFWGSRSKISAWMLSKDGSGPKFPQDSGLVLRN